MNQLATHTSTDLALTDTRSAWNVTKGSYDDLQILGVFIGTVTEAHALVAELNARDAHNIHFREDAYDIESVTGIRTADDILGSR